MSEANHYDKLSDDEIDERVTSIRLPNRPIQARPVNYCDNWSEIMPIAEEKKIALKYNEFSEQWEAIHWVRDLIYHYDKNPRRAIAITYLKMKGSEG